jgi:hypothetical protein
MSESHLPAAIEASVEAVRRATQALVRAARDRDAEATEAAVDSRAKAITRLREALAEREGAIGAGERRRIAELLAMEAEDAESRLREMIDRARLELDELARCTRVLRRYEHDAAKPASLDRAG